LYRAWLYYFPDERRTLAPESAFHLFARLSVVLGKTHDAISGVVRLS
jgi:hypothetical protein